MIFFFFLFNMYSSYCVAAAVCNVIFPFLASVSVALRLRTRSIKAVGYRADDYTVILALVISDLYSLVDVWLMTLCSAWKSAMGISIYTMLVRRNRRKSFTHDTQSTLKLIEGSGCEYTSLA